MKKIYVCSALRGDYEGNTEKAVGYCREVFRMGFIPVCPHIYFPRFADDTIDAERYRCMEIGLKMLAQCDEVWCYGEPTQGMKVELECADWNEIPVIHKADTGK